VSANAIMGSFLSGGRVVSARAKSISFYESEEVPTKADIDYGKKVVPAKVDEMGYDNKNGQFQCPHCCRKFDTHEDLQNHPICFAQPEILENTAFKSGNGSIAAVGLNLSGKIQCPSCSQKFDSERALKMHCKFIHADDGGVLMNVGYQLVYEFAESKNVDTLIRAA